LEYWSTVPVFELHLATARLGMLKGWQDLNHTANEHAATNRLPPFQGGFMIWIYPGLKPRAQSFYPFGIVRQIPTDGAGFIPKG
jgi:hypothetical protein